MARPVRSLESVNGRRPAAQADRALLRRAYRVIADLQDRSHAGARKYAQLLEPLQPRPRSAHRASDARACEPFLTRTLRALPQLGEIVADVGAGVGHHALAFARQLGGRGHVFAFEPDSRRFALLQRNVDRSQHDNVTAVRKAVSSVSGTLRVHRSTRDRRVKRFFHEPPTDAALRVPVVRLDDFFAAFDRPISVVKIDVDGAECAVLDGMRTLVARCPRMTLVVRFVPGALQEYGTTPESLLDRIAELGFDLSEIDVSNRTVAPVTPRSLLERYTPRGSSGFASTYTLATTLLCRR